MDMVQGNITPNPSHVLTSMIRVTIIRPQNIREKTMPGFLGVCRECIRATLIWLKVNNPLYANIIISEAQLDKILENGIPDEILNAVRYSDDI